MMPPTDPRDPKVATLDKLWAAARERLGCTIMISPSPTMYGDRITIDGITPAQLRDVLTRLAQETSQAPD
jgi:hypothetical protein